MLISTIAVLSSPRAAYMPALRPAGPPPKIVKSKLNYPSTYKENNLASLSESETINGTDKVTIYFEAKNAFGVNQKYKARCIFDNTNVLNH